MNILISCLAVYGAVSLLLTVAWLVSAACYGFRDRHAATTRTARAFDGVETPHRCQVITFPTARHG